MQRLYNLLKRKGEGHHYIQLQLGEGWVPEKDNIIPYWSLTNNIGEYHKTTETKLHIPSPLKLISHFIFKAGQQSSIKFPSNTIDLYQTILDNTTCDNFVKTSCFWFNKLKYVKR